jgi:hypothetical protein
MLFVMNLRYPPLLTNLPPPQLPRQLLRHLASVEEKILEFYAWDKASTIFHNLQQDPSTRTYLSKCMTTLTSTPSLAITTTTSATTNTTTTTTTSSMMGVPASPCNLSFFFYSFYF